MQSNGARLAVVAVAIGVVVALFFVLRGGDEDESPTATATEEPTTTQVARARPDKRKPDKERTPEPRPEVLTIAFEGGQPVGGVRTLEFVAGEQILFRVASDQDAEFHLHGYDVEQSAPAGGQTTFDLPADIEGVFELEDHATGAPIAEISVAPG